MPALRPRALGATRPPRVRLQAEVFRSHAPIAPPPRRCRSRPHVVVRADPRPEPVAAGGRDDRETRSRAGAAQARHRGQPDDDHRAPRRREQRAAGLLRAHQGLPHLARDRHARGRRPERDRARDLRGAGGAAHRRTRRRAQVRRRRAVLHARGRLRLLVQRRGDDREVGQAGNHRRLRADDPHHPPRRDRRLRVRRRGRRPTSPDVVAPHARGVPPGGRPHRVPRPDQGRSAAVAAEEVLLHRRLRRSAWRWPAGRWGTDAAAVRRRRDLRRRARPHLQRNRR